jgi:hypothetical protein
MGQLLVDLYKQAEAKAGITGKTRMAMKTAVPSAQAAGVPDDPDVIAKARAVIAEL